MIWLRVNTFYPWSRNDQTSQDVGMFTYPFFLIVSYDPSPYLLLTISDDQWWQCWLWTMVSIGWWWERWLVDDCIWLKVDCLAHNESGWMIVMIMLSNACWWLVLVLLTSLVNKRCRWWIGDIWWQGMPIITRHNQPFSGYNQRLMSCTTNIIPCCNGLHCRRSSMGEDYP